VGLGTLRKKFWQGSAKSGNDENYDENSRVDHVPFCFNYTWDTAIFGSIVNLKCQDSAESATTMNGFYVSRRDRPLVLPTRLVLFTTVVVS
jgi:hypothetical protein